MSQITELLRVFQSRCPGGGPPSGGRGGAAGLVRPATASAQQPQGHVPPAGLFTLASPQKPASLVGFNVLCHFPEGGAGTGPAVPDNSDLGVLIHVTANWVGTQRETTDTSQCWGLGSSRSSCWRGRVHSEAYFLAS